MLSNPFLYTISFTHKQQKNQNTLHVRQTPNALQTKLEQVSKRNEIAHEIKQQQKNMKNRKSKIEKEKTEKKTKDDVNDSKALNRLFRGEKHIANNIHKNTRFEQIVQLASCLFTAQCGVYFSIYCYYWKWRCSVRM